MKQHIAVAGIFSLCIGEEKSCVYSRLYTVYRMHEAMCAKGLKECAQKQVERDMCQLCSAEKA